MKPIDKFIRTYQSIIVSVFLLLFCLIGTVFGVVPSLQKVQELAGQIREISDKQQGCRKLDALTNLDEETPGVS